MPASRLFVGDQVRDLGIEGWAYILAIEDGLRFFGLSESGGGECFEDISFFMVLDELLPICFEKVIWRS